MSKTTAVADEHKYTHQNSPTENDFAKILQQFAW